MLIKPRVKCDTGQHDWEARWNPKTLSNVIKRKRYYAFRDQIILLIWFVLVGTALIVGLMYLFGSEINKPEDFGTQYSAKPIERTYQLSLSLMARFATVALSKPD